MYFRQVLHPDLGCASYVVADAGEAAIVDPKWEITQYLQAAAEAGAEIRHVLETHTHADHVSGRCRLASLTGAAIHVPGPDRGACAPGDTAPGDTVRVGAVELMALATPGHRPEHISYVLWEHERPRLLLSGDSLLVGDVARPDLAVSATDGARELWATLERLGRLPDEVEVWPGHVGGSLCASSSASGETSSTIGRERRANRMLQSADLGAFTKELTSALPVRPPVVEQVVGLNQQGAPDPGPVRELDAGGVACFLSAGVCVLDVRDPDSFDAGHLDGALNLAVAGSGVGTRAGWAAGTDPVLLVADSLRPGHRAAELLRAAGVWKIAGVAPADPDAWLEAGLPVRTSQALTPEGAFERLSSGGLSLIDVRDPHEWRSGHVAGSISLPLSNMGHAGASAAALEPPLGVVCAGGIRAALGASILRRRGHEPVSRVRGGVEQLAGLGLELVSGPPASQPLPR